MVSSAISTPKIARTSNGISKKKKLNNERSYSTYYGEDFEERVAQIEGNSRLAKVQRFLAKKR